MTRMGSKGVEVNQQLVRLVELLQREVELLDHRGAIVADKGLVRLADDIVHNVVGALDRNLKRK